MAGYIDRVKRAFGFFGDVDFSGFELDDSGGIKNYATVSLSTREEIADGLERFVNGELNIQNGYRAHLRLIAIASSTKERFDYVAEVVPDEDLTDREKEEETERFLKSLSKVVDNFRMRGKGF